MASFGRSHTRSKRRACDSEADHRQRVKNLMVRSALVQIHRRRELVAAAHFHHEGGPSKGYAVAPPSSSGLPARWSAHRVDVRTLRKEVSDIAFAFADACESIEAIRNFASISSSGRLGGHVC